ncbi:hypothetical protein NONO_c08390 [Nocardia nova SH22a]|uniref:Uncharacterized protein n=1 Tax=Nocardia nova SH22a TaxID=1415166 RepID=W5TEH1_9NOCA|nr:hypothetical protein [Nocardia nova]AHH15646.1 hypothetical protein NONO_c08390 [Nocardia nova SH22a]
MSVPIDATTGSTRAAPAVAAESRSRAVESGFAARAGAWIVLLGTVITTVGISWDIQWHNEVGPDTFFTLPHLFLYSGSAIAGFASLAMVVLTTSAQRAGRPIPHAGGTPIRVFGSTLTAPVGYMVSGAGAALFLLYGLFDLEWHAIYGFDAVLNTPSHVALFLSITITMIGSVMVFAAHRDELWGRAGVVCATVILIAFAPIPADGLNNLPLPIDAMVVATVLFAPLLLIMGALVLGRPGSALAIGIASAVMQGVLWWFSPWAAHVYASAVGLPLRDGLTPRPPAFPSVIPMFLFVAALAVEGLFLWFRGRSDGRPGVPALLLVAGVAAGVIIGAGLPLQVFLTYPNPHLSATTIVIPILAGIPLGLAAGYLGGICATMLRTLSPREHS